MAWTKTGWRAGIAGTLAVLLVLAARLGETSGADKLQPHRTPRTRLVGVSCVCHPPGRYNTAVLLDRQGKLVGYYDKMFPTIGEMEDGVLPGKGAVVFETDVGRIGAMICFDFNFPELLSEYKKRGAELICFLSNDRFFRPRHLPSCVYFCFARSRVAKTTPSPKTTDHAAKILIRRYNMGIAPTTFRLCATVARRRKAGRH